MDSPKSLGYYLPAEWELQAGVLFSWPTNHNTWVDNWEPVQNRYAEFVLKVACYETAYIILDKSYQKQAEETLANTVNRLGLPLGDIRFLDLRTNDVWVRDYGPIFIKNKNTAMFASTNWKYNGWGKSHPYDLDDQIPDLVSKELGHIGFKQSLVLEGGAIESNGCGDLFVSANCVLNGDRNPGICRRDIELKLLEALGGKKIHWITGCIEGDDTGGHIDNLVRFYKPDSVLVASTEECEGLNSFMIQKLKEDLKAVTLASGLSLEMVDLPMPRPVIFKNKMLPLSYLNFLIGNKAVYLPTFRQDKADQRAIEIVARQFPDRSLVSIDCLDFVREGGGLHCMTQPIPASDFNSEVALK